MYCLLLLCTNIIRHTYLFIYLFIYHQTVKHTSYKGQQNEEKEQHDIGHPTVTITQ